MRLYRLALTALLFTWPLACYGDLNSPTGKTLTVKAGSKLISGDDLFFTQKTSYVHVVFNASPYLASLPKGDAAMKALVLDLLKSEGLQQFPAATLFKVDVADVSARDDYGLPAWEKVKLIRRFVVKNGKKGLQVQAGKGAS